MGLLVWARTCKICGTSKRFSTTSQSTLQSHLWHGNLWYIMFHQPSMTLLFSKLSKVLQHRIAKIPIVCHVWYLSYGVLHMQIKIFRAIIHAQKNAVHAQRHVWLHMCMSIYLQNPLHKRKTAHANISINHAIVHAK